jgi:energy-coupling factor transporter ATP-binding protein EcfA2
MRSRPSTSTGATSTRGSGPDSGAPPPPACDWARLGAILGREDLRVIRGADRDRLRREWTEISSRELALEDRLFLGIIGGTGVGKSTLINAIAAAPISCAGDRRPTTGRVIVYRHRRQPLPDGFPRRDLAEPEAVHDEPSLERMVILDFPDFDSVEADHAAVVGRHLPVLDVLLVVVDDEKYADLRLFEVLRGLPQSPKNIHFILNKIDLLAARYPGRAHRVARDILTDLAWKLSTHAGLRPDPLLLLAVSARMAFERRFRVAGLKDGADPGREDGGPPFRSSEDGGAAPARPDLDATVRSDGRREGAEIREVPAALPEGDFASVLAILDGYRAEKRRRAAKEANLDARKAALARSVAAAGLDAARRSRAVAVRKAIGERRDELEGLLATIGPQAVGPKELEKLRSDALGQAAPRLPFPLGGVLLLVGGKKPGWAPGAGEFSALARAHYMPFREALRAAERELGDMVGEIAGCPLDAAPGSPRPDRGEALIASVRERLARALRLGRLRAHLIPALLVLGGLWFLILQPVIAQMLGGLTWSKAATDILKNLIEAMSLTGILSLLIALACAYALAAWIDARRIRRAVDGAVAGFEAAVREDARAEAKTALARIEAPLEDWERDRKELEEALGG